MLTRRYQLLLLAILVLFAYYPAVLADFSRIDDAQMAEQFRKIEEWSWRSIFIPHVGGGLYYRPLLVTSFLFDKYAFGLLPGLMHLENILLHLFNAVLVYFLTFFVLSPGTIKKSYLPLVTAILFGLHPINTESVNWISGRTDVLSCSFILMSTLFLLQYREHKWKVYLALSICFFWGGVLTKETALAFLPGAFLIMRATQPENHGHNDTTPPPSHGIKKYNVLLFVGAAVVVMLFFLLRSVAYTSNASRIAITLRCINTDWNHSLFVVLRAFGFYMKKLVFPYPLNFAIMEVDPLYELLAVPLMALCVYIALRRTLLASIFAAGIILIAPSFLIAFGQVAWTPYAERYVYITSAFFIISSTVYVSMHVPVRLASLSRIVTITLAALLFILTLNRCLIWQDDFKLCRDTVNKSPAARAIKVPYASLLADKGDFAEALRQLELGRSFFSLGYYDESFDMGIARTYYLQGRIDEAICQAEQALHKSNGTSTQALTYLTAFLDDPRVSRRNPAKNTLRLKNVFVYNTQLYEINHNLHVLYRVGIAAAELGETKAAIASLQKVFNDLPADDYYKWSAKSRINKLSHALTHYNTYER